MTQLCASYPMHGRATMPEVVWDTGLPRGRVLWPKGPDAASVARTATKSGDLRRYGGATEMHGRYAFAGTRAVLQRRTVHSGLLRRRHTASSGRTTGTTSVSADQLTCPHMSPNAYGNLA